MIAEIFWYILPGKLLGILHDYKQIFLLLMPHKLIHKDFPKNRSLENYVIFRMDDVQDYWVQAAQHAIMDLFISKNQNLSLGLVMNSIGNDSELIEKIREGNRKGLFELCLHGWDHVVYPNIDEEEQEDSLLNANEKMRTLFGSTSSIFIAPYGLFDGSTVKIMSNIGLRILSANSSAEYSFNKNKSTYVTKEKMNLNKAYQIIHNHTIYHIPTTVPFKLVLRGNWVEVPIKNIIDQIIMNVTKYGYAVVAFHPQEFVHLDKNGNFTNIVKKRNIKSFSQLIDSLLSMNLCISSFSGITETKS
jgi:peptidoglycan/xylan/chitin deacetylase (PgdA/CDA1 family)